MTQDKVTLALPSKGAIADPTISFLQECGLRVDKPNPRQYTGTIPAIPGVEVLFQRVNDVVYKVSDGTVEFGITGLDVVREHPNDNLILMHPDLGYGYCRLVVAVPESWIDVITTADLAEVALDFRENKQRNLRVATKYPMLTRQFFHSWGIHHFTLVNAEGAIEAAPTIGYADVIVDLAQTGTTLRENHLKALSDGVLVESQACLIANRTALQNPDTLEIARRLLERIDAALIGREYTQLSVNIRGESAEAVARKVAQNPLTHGLKGPTIAPVFGTDDGDSGWFTIGITIPAKNLLSAVEYLRSIGAAQAIVVPVRYLFLENSPSFARLCAQLDKR
jgi:ATP phosphoribosyltransferase